MVASETKVQTLTVDWGEAEQAPGERRQWLGAWLVSRDGMEGDFFYDGSGGQETAHAVPAEAVGFRLRWWAPAGGDEPGGAQRGRANAARPYFFDADAGPDVRVSALRLAP